MSDSNHIIVLFSGQSPDQAVSLPPHFPIYNLPHPKSESTLCIYWNKQFYELQSKQLNKYNSWFIGQRVSSSNNIYLATRIDPRFLLLPYLEKASANYSPLDQIISTPTKNDIGRIPLDGLKDWKLSAICDINDKYGDDMIFYRFNREKTLLWLEKKVNNLVKVIVKQNAARHQREKPTFVQSFNTNRATQSSSAVNTEEMKGTEEDIKLALELLCDQLTDSLSQLLVGKFGYALSDIGAKPLNTTNNKRKADWEIQLENELETAKYQTVKPSMPISNTTAVTATVKSSSGSLPTTTSAAVGTSTKTVAESKDATPITSEIKNETAAFSTVTSAFNRPSTTKPVATSKTKATKANEAAAKGSKSLFGFYTKKEDPTS